MTIALIVFFVIFILVTVIGGGNKCLPERLRKRHNDWIWILSWVPRSWTARCGWAWPMPPTRILGDSGWEMSDHHMFGHHSEELFKTYRHILPISKPGHYLISVVFFLHFIPLPMWVKTFKDGGYISLGVVRWDDVDGYYDLRRIRAHKLKAKIVLAGIGLALGAVAYYVIWPRILERALVSLG